MFRIPIAILLVLISCAGELGQALAQAGSDGRRTVGVISTVGETFTLKTQGLMVFSNESAETPIGAWGIDDRVAATVSKLLSKRFSVRKINVQRGAFADIERPNGNLFRDRAEEFRARVRTIAAPQNCDLYVVIWPTATPFGTSNQYVRGLGMFRNSGIMAGTYLHALSAITIFDGHTFKTLKEEPSSIGQATLLADIRGPHRELNDSSWPAPGNVVGNEPLRAATWALLEQSLVMTLPSLIQVD